MSSAMMATIQILRKKGLVNIAFLAFIWNLHVLLGISFRVNRPDESFALEAPANDTPLNENNRPEEIYDASFLPVVFKWLEKRAKINKQS